jgi:carboxyvinyl-carboxyphosphonate phosphorylmutase
LLPTPYGATETRLIPIEEAVGKMRAALAGRQDPRLVIVGRTAAVTLTGIADAIARLKAYEAAGVDMLFIAGVKSRAELDAIATAVKLPLFLGSAGRELYDIDYLSARNVRVCLQGHTPIMAAINAVHATLKALREGKPGWEFENISPPSELMKRATRQAEYAASRSDFLKAKTAGG